MAELTLDQLIENIQSKNDAVRAAARDGAGSLGAAALRPLAKIAADTDPETARSAQRAMQRIVYHAGRPGAEDEAQAVASELVRLLDASLPVQLQRDVLWMTWQIAGEEAVDAVAIRLGDQQLWDDARMALERLPGQGATAALQTALASAPDDQKPALAYSLRKRGVETPGVPDLRLTPTRKTSVTPVGRRAGA